MRTHKIISYGIKHKAFRREIKRKLSLIPASLSLIVQAWCINNWGWRITSKRLVLVELFYMFAFSRMCFLFFGGKIMRIPSYKHIIEK